MSTLGDQVQTFAELKQLESALSAGRAAERALFSGNSENAMRETDVNSATSTFYKKIMPAFAEPFWKHIEPKARRDGPVWDQQASSSAEFHQFSRLNAAQNVAADLTTPLGANEKRCIEEIFVEIKRLILNSIETDPLVALCIREWVCVHTEILLNSSHSEHAQAMWESREAPVILPNGNTQTGYLGDYLSPERRDQCAWRNFDPLAPIAVWENPLQPGTLSCNPNAFVGNRTKTAQYNPIPEVQRRIAYQYLLTIDETPEYIPAKIPGQPTQAEKEECLALRKADFLSGLYDIRCTHNNLSPTEIQKKIQEGVEESYVSAHATEGIDNPSCLPGTYRRIGQMSDHHAQIQVPQVSDLLLASFKEIRHTTLQAAFRDCASLKDKQNLKNALVDPDTDALLKLRTTFIQSLEKQRETLLETLEKRLLENGIVPKLKLLETEYHEILEAVYKEVNPNKDALALSTAMGEILQCLPKYGAIILNILEAGELELMLRHPLSVPFPLSYTLEKYFEDPLSAEEKNQLEHEKAVEAQRIKSDILIKYTEIYDKLVAEQTQIQDALVAAGIADLEISPENMPEDIQEDLVQALQTSVQSSVQSDPKLLHCKVLLDLLEELSDDKEYPSQKWGQSLEEIDKKLCAERVKRIFPKQYALYQKYNFIATGFKKSKNPPSEEKLKESAARRLLDANPDIKEKFSLENLLLEINSVESAVESAIADAQKNRDQILQANPELEQRHADILKSIKTRSEEKASPTAQTTEQPAVTATISAPLVFSLSAQASSGAALAEAQPAPRVLAPLENAEDFRTLLHCILKHKNSELLNWQARNTLVQHFNIVYGTQYSWKHLSTEIDLLPNPAHREILLATVLRNCLLESETAEQGCFDFAKTAKITATPSLSDSAYAATEQKGFWETLQGSLQVYPPSIAQVFKQYERLATEAQQRQAERRVSGSPIKH